MTTTPGSAPPSCPRCGKPHQVSVAGNPTVGCSAHNSTGAPCGNAPMRGQTTCRYHGGGTPASRAKAANAMQEARQRKEMERAVRTLGARLDISPEQALLDEVQFTAGNVAWLREKVQNLEHMDLIWGPTQTVEVEASPNPGTNTTEAAAVHLWYSLYLKERQHLVHVSAVALKAGIEERRLRLAEEQGALVAQVIQLILGDLRLTKDQWEAVPRIVPTHLRLLAEASA